MKTKGLMFLLVAGMFSFMSFKNTGFWSETDRSVAKVNQINGKYVFGGCTPIQPYETAFQFSTSVGGFGCPSISEMAEACVKSANKKGLPYDAIIMGNGKYDLAIKFK